MVVKVRSNRSIRVCKSSLPCVVSMRFGIPVAHASLRHPFPPARQRSCDDPPLSCLFCFFQSSTRRSILVELINCHYLYATTTVPATYIHGEQAIRSSGLVIMSIPYIIHRSLWLLLCLPATLQSLCMSARVPARRWSPSTLPVCSVAFTIPRSPNHQNPPLQNSTVAPCKHFSIIR